MRRHVSTAHFSRYDQAQDVACFNPVFLTADQRELLHTRLGRQVSAWHFDSDVMSATAYSPSVFSATWLLCASV